MFLKVSVPPTEEPVSKDLAKLFMKLRRNNEDLLVDTFRVTAREQAEVFTNRGFMTQTWELTLDRFPSRVIKLPPTVATVISINTYDEDDDATEYDAANYYLINNTVVLKDASTWPSDFRRVGGIKILFTVGSADAPPWAVAAILLTVNFWFRNRESQEMPLEAKKLLMPHKVNRV